MKWTWILKGHSGFLAGLFVCGTVLVIAGPLVQNQIMTAIGGALVGGSIGSLIAEIDGHEFQNKTLRVMESTLSTRFVSDENRIKRFRKRWHVYYQTKVQGKHEWRHSIWDLQEQIALGGLIGTNITYDQQGNAIRYELEVGHRDGRIVGFLKRPDSDEPCSVCVLPSMGEFHHDSHCGLTFHITWDGNHSVDPVIVRSAPLNEVGDLGVIKDDREIDLLIQHWRSRFGRLHDMLPNGCST